MSYLTNYTDEDRARIARQWRRSGLDQNTYASQHGISSRTLREWRAKYAPDTPPDIGAVRRVIEDALRELQALLAGLEQGDVHEAVQRRAPATIEPPEPPTPPSAPARRVAAPEEHDETGPCQPECQQEPRPEQPKRRGNFFIADWAG